LSVFLIAWPNLGAGTSYTTQNRDSAIGVSQGLVKVALSGIRNPSKPPFTKGYWHGCLLVAMIQGLLAGSVFWLNGVPFSVPWGVVTVFGGFGVILGPVLFALLAALILYHEEYRLSRKE